MKAPTPKMLYLRAQMELDGQLQYETFTGEPLGMILMGFGTWEEVSTDQKWLAPFFSRIFPNHGGDLKVRFLTGIKN